MSRDFPDNLAARMIQALILSIIISPWLPPVVLLIIALLTPFFVKRPWPIRGFPEGIFIGFLLLSAISWCFNPSWIYGIPVGLIPMAVFLAYYLLAVWIKRGLDWSWYEIQRLYLLFWVAGLYIAVVVLLQGIGWISQEASWWGRLLGYSAIYQNDLTRSVGTSTNSNLAAALLICLALISTYAFSVLKKRWQKVAALAAFFLFCVAIWMTGSRGAWVGLTVGLLVQVWMTGNRRRTVLLFAFLVLLGYVIYTNQTLIPREETLFATITVRIFVWQNAFRIFQDHWLLGVLPLHFSQVFAELTGKHIYHAHNIFLGVATEFGVVGLVLFLLMIGLTVYRARKWRKMAIRLEEKRLSGMMLSLIFAFLGHGMYDYTIIAPQVGSLFFLSVILIHWQYERRCRMPAPSPRVTEDRRKSSAS
mgnify:CR=1 FL=1